MIFILLFVYVQKLLFFKRMFMRLQRTRKPLSIWTRIY